MDTLHGHSQKRPLSLLSEDENEEEAGYCSSNATSSTIRPLKKLKLGQKTKLFYPEEEARAAMRGELVATPSLGNLLESIVRTMKMTNQLEGRHLGSNGCYAATKGVLKQNQAELVGLERYLLAEAFIRTDVWMSGPLQDWFDLVHKAGLEKMFRNAYWEANQRAHTAKIRKLFDCITRPLIRSDPKLAEEYEHNAKELMSRSVYVDGPDHPIIRSAVAIMVVAEEEKKDDFEAWEKVQEKVNRTTQIWAAWCLSRDKDWIEARYLAATILDRTRKNNNVRMCFIHEHNHLQHQKQKGYDVGNFKKWQKMHWKCHVISQKELIMRPVVVKSTSIAHKDMSNSQGHTSFKPIGTATKKQDISANNQDPPIRKPSSAPNPATGKPKESMDTSGSPTKSRKDAGMRQQETEVPDIHQGGSSRAQSEIQQLPTALAPPVAPAASIDPSTQSMTAADFTNMLTVLMRFSNMLTQNGNPGNQANSQQTAGAKTEKDPLQEASTKLNADLKEKLDPLSQMMSNFAADLTQVIDAVQSVGDKQAAVEDDTRKKLREQDEAIRKLREEVDELKTKAHRKEMKRFKAAESDETTADSIVCAPVATMFPSTKGGY